MKPLWPLLVPLLAAQLSCKTPCTETTLIDVEIQVWDFGGDCYRTVTEQRPCKFWGMDCSAENVVEYEWFRSLSDGRCVVNDEPCNAEYAGRGNPDMGDCSEVEGCCDLRDRWLNDELEILPCPGE